MRKQILTATLAGLCLVGVTACDQKSDQNKDATTTAQATTETATQNAATAETNTQAANDTTTQQPEQQAPAQQVADASAPQNPNIEQAPTAPTGTVQAENTPKHTASNGCGTFI